LAQDEHCWSVAKPSMFGALASSTENRFAALDSPECSGSDSEGPKSVGKSLATKRPAVAIDTLEKEFTARLRPVADRKQFPFDYFVVVDFECTCDRHDWPEHEIIEFPAVFLNARTLEVDMEFHRFVRPVERPILTSFCTELTGISQSDVDRAQPLEFVLGEFHEFLNDRGLVSQRRCRSEENPLFVICTDGPWDIRRFIRLECERKRLSLDHCWHRWVDVRRAFERRYGHRCGVAAMLHHLGMDFDGREHSGRDDARNITRIARALLQQGELKPESR